MADVDHELSAIRFVVVRPLKKKLKAKHLKENLSQHFE